MAKKSVLTRLGHTIKRLTGIQDISLFKKQVHKAVGQLFYHKKYTAEDVVAVMKELGLKAEDYEFYTDLRKYGTVTHSGYGLGFERCVMYLTGMQNIRDVIPFPRTVGNCDL